MALTKIPRFVIWICSKFNRNEIEQIILGLIEILSNKDHKIKPKDEIKHKYPNYRNFYVDPKPPLEKPAKKNDFNYFL